MSEQIKVGVGWNGLWSKQYARDLNLNTPTNVKVHALGISDLPRSEALVAS